MVTQLQTCNLHVAPNTNRVRYMYVDTRTKSGTLMPFDNHKQLHLHFKKGNKLNPHLLPI